MALLSPSPSKLAARLLILFGIAFLGVLSACSPRNPLDLGDDDDSAALAACGSELSQWPPVLSEYASYEGTGASSGDYLLNFNLEDQFGETACLAQFLGQVLIIDMSTRWCGPCNDAAAESAELLTAMRAIGPSWIITLMVQDIVGLPATSQDLDDWVELYDIEYPVLLDNNEQTRAEWAVLSFPLFLFVAPTGEIIERIEQRPSEAEVLAFVSSAVEEWASDLRPIE